MIDYYMGGLRRLPGSVMVVIVYLQLIITQPIVAVKTSGFSIGIDC